MRPPLAAGAAVNTSEEPREPRAGDETEPTGWRASVERGFEWWGFFVCRQRWPVALGMLLVTVWAVSFTPGITIDNSTEAMLLDDDPAVVVYNGLRDEFARDDFILIAVDAPDLFDLAFLERLRTLHEAIESDVPYVEEVDSLINARRVHGDDAALHVDELLEEWPETAADLAMLRERVVSNPLYEHTLVSSDLRTTAVAIKPFTYSAVESVGDGDVLAGFDDTSEEAAEYLTAAEGDELMATLLELVAEHEGPGFGLHVAGALPMTYRMNQGMVRDLGTFLPVTLLIMGLLLAALFRRVGGVFFPLLIVLLSLLSTLGIMVMLGIPGSTAVQILPIFLLTVGVCDAVHILAITYRNRSAGEGQTDAIAHAIGHSGLAIVMTSLTTAAGMASFAFAEMAAVVDLGVLAPIGIVLALVYTLTLLPALLAIFPLPEGQLSHREAGFPLERFLIAAGEFATRAPHRVLVPTALVCALLVLGALQVRFSHDALRWFPEDDRVRLDFERVDQALGGAVSVDILIDSGEPGGVYEPELLRRIDRIVAEAPSLPAAPLFIVKGMSIVDIVKETHQALAGGDPAMYRIPDTREAVAQELLLFENGGSEDTRELVDSEYRRARISLRIPFKDAFLYPPLLEDLEALVAKRLDGTADFEVTGLMALLARIFHAMMESMLRSYAFALLVITPLMMLLLGSLRRGLVSMVPNLLPVLAVIGVMGWVGWVLDPTTIIVGAMVIGLAVDDTIHFMHKFQTYFERTGDLQLAVRETLRTTGSALLFTSLVISGGFIVFGLSEMANTRTFGVLASMAAISAFAADLLVAPAMLSVVEGARRSRRAPSQAANDELDRAQPASS